MAETETNRCPDCGVEFDTTEALEQHAEKEHHSEPMRAGQRQSREGNSASGPQLVRPSDQNNEKRTEKE